jgi:hypothetical protein
VFQDGTINYILSIMKNLFKIKIQLNIILEKTNFFQHKI